MARLDMKHGFLRYITKNQIDRDNYDKEVKEQRSVGVRRSKAAKETTRSRKPAQEIYRPPTDGCKTRSRDPAVSETEGKVYDKVDVNFRDEDGIIHQFRVHAADDPEEVAANFCTKMGYSSEYVIPLKNKIVEECSKYFTFTAYSL